MIACGMSVYYPQYMAQLKYQVDLALGKRKLCDPCICNYFANVKSVLVLRTCEPFV